jgi:hypothetical protein
VPAGEDVQDAARCCLKWPYQYTEGEMLPTFDDTKAACLRCMKMLYPGPKFATVIFTELQK